VAALAKHLLTGMFIDGVITGKQDTPLRHKVVNDPTGQAVGQPPTGPASLGEDTVIAGGMTRSQGTKCA
jgi:hypothetical protein